MLLVESSKLKWDSVEYQFVRYGRFANGMAPVNDGVIQGDDLYPLLKKQLFDHEIRELFFIRIGESMEIGATILKKTWHDPYWQTRSTDDSSREVNKNYYDHL